MIPKDKPRILAVVDVQDNLDLIRAAFENEPYDMATTLDTEEALQFAREEFPDVAIVDAQMPDVDGYALCQKFRELKRARRLPVVFLTTNRASAGDVVQGPDAGSCDYITKPFEPEELRAMVRAVFRAQHERARRWWLRLHNQDLRNRGAS